MKVNMDVQLLTVPREKFRGLSMYIYGLSNALIKRSTYKYSFSFFDYNKERNNRQNVCNYLGMNIELCECNSMSYLSIIEANRTNSLEIYNSYNYSDLVGAKADVYHFPYSRYIPMNINGPTVVTVHDIIPVIEEFNYCCSENHILEFKNTIDFIKKRKDIYIAVNSTCTKTDLINYSNINPDRIFLTPLGFCSQKVSQNQIDDILLKFGIDSPYILYLGALDPRKGIDILLSAFDKIKEKGVKLVIAGSTASTPFFDVSDKLNLCSRKNDIIFTGYVSEIEKNCLLSGAEIFIFPSLYEGFGLPILEAFDNHCPVICSNTSSLPEVGGDAALYFDPTEKKELIDQIMKIINNPDLRNEMIKMGVERTKLFTWENTAKEIYEIYKTLSSEG